MVLSKEDKAAIVKEFGSSENDVGSTPVQVAILTAEIKYLTEHLRRFPKDHHTRRGLLKKVGRRRRLLRYYKRRNFEGYKELIQKLGIRR